MRKPQIRFRSFYTKLVVMFLLMGVIPFLLMEMLIYNVYSSTMYKNIIGNFSMTDQIMAKNISGLIAELSDDTEYIYKSSVSDYDYFYELFEDTEMSETGRNAMITKVLRTILYMNEAIDHVFFITPDGKMYSSMKAPELLVNEQEMQEWYKNHYLTASRDAQVLSTHDTKYYRNSQKNDFTIYRNIMNTATIQKAGSEVLGTLFIDISVDYLKKMLTQEKYGTNREIYIVDSVSGKYIYHSQKQYEGTNAKNDGILWDDMKDGEGGCLEKKNECFIYQKVDGTNWIVIDKVIPGTIEGAYRMIRNTTMLLIMVGVSLLAIVYMYYSKKLNKPVQILKETMSCIEKGDLDVRVHIDSNDEFQDIGNGMNQMAENLSKYVQKAYVAEIRQKDAELEALKRQIQPHYLYNTLDVIRMSAITNDDMLVAAMIDGLSGQLKYLIGTTGNMVMLQQEIACISNYFKLIEVRYDSRFSLSVDIPKELWKCRVPHLIIQPVVENAVKHGLRPNKGAGEVVVQAKQNMDFLEITVMDNGVGMNKERLEEVQKLLKSDARVAEEDIKGMSIGVKNVSDRIKHLYGNEYGLEIDAYEGMGTIVKYWLPLIWEDK